MIGITSRNAGGMCSSHWGCCMLGWELNSVEGRVGREECSGESGEGRLQREEWGGRVARVDWGG